MSTTDNKICIHPILEKKFKLGEAVYKLFIELNKAYDSLRR